MATVLWREIRAQGFAYSLTNVQRFVNQLRRDGPPPDNRPRTALTQPHGPPPRRVAALALRRPERRTDEQCAYLTLLRAEDAAIAAAVDLAEDKPRHRVVEHGGEDRWPIFAPSAGNGAHS